ncbi:GlcG/HbpS family heme-binding protein [Streptomyces seoulensis]
MITLAAAEKAIEAGKRKGAELGVAFTISVVDAGAHLIAAARVDGAALAAVETSQTKARTSVLFAQATKDLVPAVQPGAPLFGVEAGTRDPLAFVPGGIPVVVGGTLVGAVGVGGGTPDQDHEVAAAALAAL